MAGEITQQQLINAGLDAASLAAVVNGASTDPDVTTRLGATMHTLAHAIAQIAADLTPIGEFDPTVTYVKLNVVSYQGTSYISLADGNINNYPNVSATQWLVLAAKGNPGSDAATLTPTAPIVINAGNISMAAATSLVDGFLSHVDWQTFNAKQNALTLPAGAIVGDSDTQTLTNKTIDVSQLTGLIAAALLPKATSGTVGAVKVDGTTITVAGDGTITAAATPVPVATTSVAGKVKPDGTTISVAGDGTISVLSAPLIGSTGVIVDGGASVPGLGSKGVVQIPYNANIIGWSIFTNATGNATFDIKKGTFAAFPANASIVASLPPTLSSGQASTSTTLTGWTTTITAGDVLEFFLGTATGATHITLVLKLQRT